MKLNNFKLFIFTLVVAGLFNTTDVCSQGTNYISKLMPPSANPAALAKFVDNPVSYYTGIPEIRIPIWEVKLKGFSLPIAFNYHAGGVKVEEEASMVGLGWILSAGGVVTRSVRNYPDDYNRDQTMPRLQEMRQTGPEQNDEFMTVGRFWSGKYEVLRDLNVNSSDRNYLLDNLSDLKKRSVEGTDKRALYGNCDIEPDVFYFSFGNKSGKFVFDVEGNIQKAVMFPNQDMEIKHNLDAKGNISSFSILDNDGTEYFFGDIEILTRTNGSDNFVVNNFRTTYDEMGFEANMPTFYGHCITYNSSWYLSKITTSNGEEITLYYENEELKQNDRPSLVAISGMFAPSRNFHGVTTASAGINESTTKKRISRIESINEIIYFHANHKREDLVKSSYAITSVEIRSKMDNAAVKKFNMQYSYFQSPSNESFYKYYEKVLFPSVPVADQTFYHKRLKLDKIYEIGSDNSEHRPYEFEYDMRHNLPHRFSVQQDLWGFFNGAIGNTNLFPKLYVYHMLDGSDRFKIQPDCEIHPPQDQFVIQGNNRVPNPNTLTTGTLKKIVYPTGGKVEYSYSPHDFIYSSCLNVGGGIRIDTIKMYRNKNDLTPTMQKVYSYKDNQGKSSGRITSMPIYVDMLFNWLRYYSNSQASLNNTQGSFVGYEYVSEKNIDIYGHDIGRTDYEYGIPAQYNEINDPVYGLYNISQVKWMDSYSATDTEFQLYKSYYHLLPNTSPFPPNPDYDWNRGKLLRFRNFSKEGKLVKETVNTYKIYTSPLWKGRRNVYGLLHNHIGFVEFGDYILRYSKYEYLTNRANVLDSTVTKTYQDPTSFTTQVDKYVYSEVGHMNPIEIISKMSDGTTTVKKSKFVYDYSFDTPPPLELIYMKRKNMSAIPIEQISYKQVGANRKVTESVLYRYGLHGQKVLLDKTYRLETTEPVSNFQESYSVWEELVMDTRYESTESFLRYDNLGNPLEFQEKSRPVVSLIWSQDGQNLLAKADNALSTDIAFTDFENGNKGNWTWNGQIKTGNSYDGNKHLAFAPMGGGSITKTGLNPAKKYRVSFWAHSWGGGAGNGFIAVGSKGEWIQYEKVISGVTSFTYSNIDYMIDNIAICPIDAVMATFSYMPLVGMTGTTDARGIKTEYTYDGFQRLKDVLDFEGNILKNYRYHYRP